MHVRITMGKLSDSEYNELLKQLVEYDALEVNRTADSVSVSATGTVEQCVYVAAICDIFNAAKPR